MTQIRSSAIAGAAQQPRCGRRLRRLWALGLLALSAAALAGPRAGDEIVFVSCPILRNTALPCWLGQSEGELYYLGPQGDLTAAFYPPQFRHRMLVEAVVDAGPELCGGIALRDVRVSVLPDIDIDCNSMLPAAGYPDPPHMRGTGPSGVRGGVPPAPPTRPKPEQFQPPFAARSFEAPFNVDSERLWGPAQSGIADAARFAAASGAAHIVITAHRAAIRLSNGQEYVERAATAQARAAAVLQALQTIGLPQATHVTVHWQRQPEHARGLEANARARRVSILVVP